MSAAPQTDAQPRTNPLALLGWMVFAALLVYVIFIGGGYTGTFNGQYRLLSLGIIAAGLAVWAVLAVLKPEWRPRSAIWPALLVPLVTMVVTTLLSDYPRLGLEYVLWATLLVTLYLFLARILSFDFARARIGGVAAILAFTVAGAYLVGSVSAWVEYWGLVGRLTAPILRPAYSGLPFGGPTAVASVTILLTVTACAGLGMAGRKRQAVLGALLVISVAAVFVTGGRTAWLSSAVALLVVGLVFVTRNHSTLGSLWGRSRAVLSQRRWRLVLLGALVLTVMAAVLFAPAVATRLDFSSDGGRGMFLATTMRMFEDSPLTGQGPGTWTAQRMVYTEAGEADIFVSHAHNIYTQTLAEIGLLGIGAGIVAALALLWLIRRGVRDTAAERRRYGYGALFVLVYIGVYGLLDSYVDLPLAFVLAALPFALLDGTTREAIGDRFLKPGAVGSFVRVAGAASLFAVAILAAFALFRLESIAAVNRNAVAAVNTGDWEIAMEAAGAAVASDSDMIPYQVTLGMAAVGAGDWETAAAALQRVANEDDRPEAWANLALAKLEAGHPEDGVVDALERALRVDHSSHASVKLAVASLYDRLDMSEESDRLYAELLAARPGLAADPYWDAMEPARFQALLDEAMATTARPWELALMAGEVELARQLAIDAEDAALVSDVVEAWIGDPAAADRIRDASLSAPGDWTPAGWATRISARQGDADLTTRFRRIQQIAQQGTAGINVYWGWEDGILPVDGSPRGGTARVSDIHGATGYRRATPSGILAHGLPAMILVDSSVEE